MYYQLACSCGAVHAVTKSQAGQSLTCSCGENLQIPTLRGLQDLPRAEEPQATASSTTAAAQATRSQPAILTGLLTLTFFVALGCLIFFAYTRLTMDTSQSEESERQAAFAAIDQASPTVLSDAWHQYSSTALGLPSKPSFYYVERRRDFYNMAIAISTAALAISGLTAVAVTLAKRKQSSQ